MKYIYLIVSTLFSLNANSETLFPNSVVSNDIDFITADDPAALSRLTFTGIAEREMPDRRSDTLIDKHAFTFKVTFSDSTTLDVWAHSDFSGHAEAEPYIRTLLAALGRLPLIMRHTLSYIVLHKGDSGAFAEHLGHFFVLYSDNIITRLKNNDLEETLFHESVHATLDFKHRNSPEWVRAQNADNIFITKYGADNPTIEDLAETALFVYTQMKYPDRLPAHIHQWILENIPNRAKYIREIFTD